MKRGTAKSRVLAWFLAIVMVITFVPVNTYAETTPEKENDEQENEVAPESETVTFMNDESHWCLQIESPAEMPGIHFMPVLLKTET